MLGSTIIKPTQANMWNNVAHVGSITTGHLSKHFRKYTGVFASLWLVAWYFGNNRVSDPADPKHYGETTYTKKQEPFKYAQGNITNSNDGVSVYTFDSKKPSTEVKNKIETLIEENTLYVGKQIEGAFTNEELKANYTLAMQIPNAEGKITWIYWSQDSGFVRPEKQATEAEMNDQKLQKVYFRNNRLPKESKAGEKYHSSNLITEGLDRNAQWDAKGAAKEQLVYTQQMLKTRYAQAIGTDKRPIIWNETQGIYIEAGKDVEVKDEQKTYYINPNLAPGSEKGQLNHANNLINVGDDVTHWDAVMIQKYRLAKHSVCYANSWKEWDVQNPVARAIKAVLVAIEYGIWRLNQPVSVSSLSIRPLYTISGAGLVAAGFSKVIHRQV